MKVSGVLARKWRSAQLSDIVGQGPVVLTLMNAIRHDRIHQAYLFTGSRGIGKTSIARIFSKLLRCPDRKEVLVDGVSWLESCDTCASCVEVRDSRGIDVLEIDGASNNGVESIREIRESTKYLPATGNRKIYIIDEVHMLTTPSFNALLKTLEEPPPHVVFIFATTESHKIPATILSRVQRFDFRRVTVPQIEARLKRIAQAEEISLGSDSAALIARAADGSMRDALSLFDQVIAFTGGSITAQSVRESIGLIGSEQIASLLEAILARRPLDALASIREAHGAGHDLRKLLESLIEWLHAVTVAKVGGTSTLEGFSPEEQTRIKGFAQMRELEELELIFQVFHHGLDTLARSPQPRLVLDILAIKCATAEALERLDRTRIESPPTTPSNKPVSAVPAAKTVQAKPEIKTSPLPSSPVGTTWEGFIAHVRQGRPLLGSLLEHARVERGPKQELVLIFRPEDSFRKEQVSSTTNLQQLRSFAAAYYAAPIEIKVAHGTQGQESIAEQRDRTVKTQETKQEETIRTHPILQEAQALFRTHLGPIELLKGDEQNAD